MHIRRTSVIRRPRWILNPERIDSPPACESKALSVLEMRPFGIETLMQHFVDANFSNIRVYSDEVPERGILWIPYDPLEAPYDPLSYGLDTLP
jgi:hypothetical protein